VISRRGRTFATGTDIAGQITVVKRRQLAAGVYQLKLRRRLPARRHVGRYLIATIPIGISSTR
jgi:hypothetical protein